MCEKAFNHILRQQNNNENIICETNRIHNKKGKPNSSKIGCLIKAISPAICEYARSIQYKNHKTPISFPNPQSLS